MAAIDFSPLERLLGTYDKNRIAGIRAGLPVEAATSNPDSLAQLLFAAGDLEGGMPFANLANTRAQQEWTRKLQSAQLDVSRSQLDVARQNANKPQIVGSAEHGYYAIGPDGLPISAPAPAGAPAPAPAATPPPPMLFGNQTPNEAVAGRFPQHAGERFTLAPGAAPGGAPPSGMPPPAAQEPPRATAPAQAGIRPIIPGVKTDDTIANEATLRKEFEANSKTYLETRRGYERLLASKDNAAGDISLIFGYMKVLDPGSVVKEGEFATVQNSGGIPERVINMYNRARAGERLTPAQREMFKAQGEQLYSAARQEHEAREGQFRDIVKRYGLNPDRVIPNFGPGPKAIRPSGSGVPPPPAGFQIVAP